MATEFEELRITVKLVGDTSREMALIREHFGALVQQSREIEYSRHRAQLLGREVKALSEALGGFGRVVGVVSKGLLAVFSAHELRKQWRELTAWSTDIVQTTNQLRQIGASYASFRGIADQFRRVGISAQETMRILSGVANAVADLSRPGSTIWDRMMQGTAPGSVDAMAQALRRIRESRTLHEATYRTQILLQNIYTNELRRTKNELLARAVQREAAEALGVDPTIVNATVRM